MSAHSAESSTGVAAETKLPKLARKRLMRFVTLFPKALVSDTPETIHDLRVASRRLQEALRLFLSKAKSSGARKSARMLRKVRRAFGPCRNLDVTIKLTESKLTAATTAAQRQAWEQVRLWLAQKRAAEIDRGRAELKRYDLTQFIARIQAQIENIDEEPEAVARLWDRAKEALADWKDALGLAKENPQIDRIHAFRIAGKRLRYRAESIVEAGDASIKPLVQSLKALQDDLGDCHDRFILREVVAEFIGRRGFLKQEPGMCRTLLLDMEREKQREHAAISEAMAKAEKLAERHMEITASEPPAGEAGQAQ